MADRIIGILEDVGKSVLICDNDRCEAMYAKLDRRYADGDECPTCTERDEDTTDAAIMRAANRYGRQ